MALMLLRGAHHRGRFLLLLFAALLTPVAMGQNVTGDSVPVQTAGGGLSTNAIIIIVVCSVGGFIIVGALAGLLILFTRKGGKKADNEAPPAVKINHVAPDWQGALDPYNPQNDAEFVARVFSYKEIQTATRNFNPQHLVGQGGFGRVYYAKLADGRVAAVKQLDRAGRQGEKEFRVEVDLLSRLSSPFLLSLWGYCADEEHRILVYGFMPNGSLQEHLFSDGRPGSPQPLDWAARLQIALDAARGLEYLHEVAQPTIIHRDFKSSNVLLDLNYRAKVSDFGLAKLSPEKGEYVSTRVLGTQGYVAPEYALTGHLTTKSDVYSYGVVLLELITGRCPVDHRRRSGEIVLVPWAMPLLNDRKRIAELVDPRIEGQYSTKDLTQLAAIAALCVQGQADYRPLMRDVVQSLLPLVMSSAKSHSGGASGCSVDSRRKENEQFFLAQMADVDGGRAHDRSAADPEFESREFSTQEIRHAVEARYPGSVRKDDRSAGTSGELAEEGADQPSDEEGSDGGAETRERASPDFYDALSRQPSALSQRTQSPGRLERPGDGEEDDREGPPGELVAYDGWKSTPSGQIYVSRDYDIADIHNQFVQPGFDIGALAATDSYGRGPYNLPGAQSPGTPPPPRISISHARSPGYSEGGDTLERGAGNQGLFTPPRRLIPSRWSPARLPRYPSGAVSPLPELELTEEGYIEHDGLKQTPNGDIYVSRDFDSGEVRDSVERLWDGGKGSREGLLRPGTPTGQD